MAEDTNSTKADKVVTTVVLEDGRAVDFVGKRKLLKETIIEGDVVSVRLDFINGQTRLFECPSDLILKAAGHGLEQKLGDEVAGVADPDDQVLAIDELIERLAKGPEGWTTQRQSSGIAGTSVLFKALCEAYPDKAPAALKEYLKTKTQADKIALRNSKRLKPIVERLEAEKAAGSKVDADALLSELD
jgi:hypothetical protein